MKKIKTFILMASCLAGLTYKANSQTPSQINICVDGIGHVRIVQTPVCQGNDTLLTLNTGNTGTTLTISIGTVTTVPPTSPTTPGQATVTIDPSSTPTNIILNFGIPQGIQGNIVGANQYTCVRGATVATGTAAPFNVNNLFSSPSPLASAPGVSTSGSQFTNFILQPGTYALGFSIIDVSGTWGQGANGMAPNVNGTYPTSLKPTDFADESWNALINITQANSVLQLITLNGGSTPPVDGLCLFSITQVQ